jgi:Carboxypeptidase regulatory-like domain
MRRIVVVVAAVVLTGCASAGEAPTGGIEGSVTAGPTCPVETQGSPCPPQVWTGTVRATAADGSEHEALTDGAGRYRMQLEPGTYSVVAVVEGSGPPLAKPVTVTVGDSMQTLDLQVDTGLR